MKHQTPPCFFTILPLSFFIIASLLSFPEIVAASDLRLEISGLPDSGLLVRSLDISPAIRYANLDSDRIVGAELRCGETVLPNQLVFNDLPDDTRRIEVYLIVRFPEDLILRSRKDSLSCDLNFSTDPNFSRKEKILTVDRSVTKTPVYRIIQESNAFGGLPLSIEFLETGRILQSHRWHDRLHHPERPGYQVDASGPARLAVLDDGPICRIVRNEVVFKKDSPSSPKVFYTWFFFKEPAGSVFVTTDYSQPESVEWKERHFLELHVPDGSFGEYSTIDKPAERKKFDGSNHSISVKGAAIHDGKNRLAVFGGNNVTVYDGLGGFGPYILANGNDAWTVWNETTGHESAWLQIGGDVSFSDFDRNADIRASIPALEETAKTWIDVARNAMYYAGILKTKEELEAFKPNENLLNNERYVAIRSDRLGMLLERTEKENDHGVRLAALVDIPTLTLLTPHTPQSLFTIKLRETKNGSKDFSLHELKSDRGWESVEITAARYPDTKDIALCFLTFKKPPQRDGDVKSPQDPPQEIQFRLCIQTRPEATKEPCTYHPACIEMLWPKEQKPLPENLSLESVVLPDIRLASFGSPMKAFYPQASGIVVDAPFGQNRQWKGRYPSGWSSMPWFAVWNDTMDKTKQVGIYIAAHEQGTTKDQAFRCDSKEGTVRISLEYPAENPGRKDSRFAPSRAVLQSYNGDWFDAATMYKNWVIREAKWFPREKLGPEGRTDTPDWMKELAVWTISSDPPPNMPGVLRKFQQPLGVPVAVHWYNWHKNPFDNDYPHFFPVKDGFKASVAEIQKDGDLFVMPYINGRLWDRRDRGIEDWLFTEEALPGVTKKEDGTPYFESYGSKESDGSNVELGAMCPASEVWKAKQQELIRRLTEPSDGKPGDDGAMGVKGVYVDQVAAAEPTLCFDASHGHPLGGGDWWVTAYAEMFHKIRQTLPDGAILTTECNAEPFIDLFDGYLTWHFQHQGQVPAFAAVYGGSIQMFGRNYGGGPDPDTAGKMKMAESFVFGEQIGWISPYVMDNSVLYDYLKKVVALRYAFREYFYKGVMARPPKLSGEMPTITADWHFFNPTIITTDAVRCGAWRIAEPRKLLLLFANCSEEKTEHKLEYDLEEYGFEPEKTDVVRHHPDGTKTALEKFPETLRFEPLEVFVLEIQSK